MTNADLINKVLMEMTDVVDYDIIKKLKTCLERNFYNLTIIENSTEIVPIQKTDNETLFKRFLFERKVEGLSDRTLEQYARETNRFFSIIDKSYDEITSEDINYYLACLLSKDIAMNTVDNARKFLKPFFRWLYENDYIPKDIFLKIKPIKYPDKQKDYLTELEIVNIRDACNDDKRALALIDFLLSTGVRVSECASVKISDINFDINEVTIYATKTRQYRKVYLDSNASIHLKDYLSTREDDCPYLFVNTRKVDGRIKQMTKDSIESLVHRYCYKAHIHKTCNVHLFRKTLATRLYKRGLDISIIAKILGHNSVKTTEKYYLTICDSDINYLYHKCS